MKTDHHSGDAENTKRFKAGPQSFLLSSTDMPAVSKAPSIEGTDTTVHAGVVHYEHVSARRGR